MELTTRLPAPSNVSIIAVTLKVTVLLAAFMFLIMDHSNETSKSSMVDYTTTTSFITSFFNETLPRLVASGLTLYVSICCGYVGLVHLGWLPN
eukprot:scaffold4646_cov267-Chaetoceros_neogracile.AAC.8